MINVKPALAALEYVKRQKKRGLYSFAVNYDAPIDRGFDSATTGFYMALEQVGLSHLDTLIEALESLNNG